MKNFLKEFKEFAMKGNVIDLAVGMMIGSAFGTIINSLVADILTPLISLVIGSTDFSGLRILLVDKGEESVYLNYGSFIQYIFNFIIIAFCIFLMIKAINKLKSPKEEEVVAEVEISNEAKALNEIIEILKERK